MGQIRLPTELQNRPASPAPKSPSRSCRSKIFADQVVIARSAEMRSILCSGPKATISVRRVPATEFPKGHFCHRRNPNSYMRPDGVAVREVRREAIEEVLGIITYLGDAHIGANVKWNPRIHKTLQR